VKEASLFALSCLNEVGTEYWALSNETKLSKIALAGWKEGRTCRELTLFQRFKFHPGVKLITTFFLRHLS
jgi:hypothetical protein